MKKNLDNENNLEINLKDEFVPEGINKINLDEFKTLINVYLNGEKSLDELQKEEFKVPDALARFDQIRKLLKRIIALVIKNDESVLSKFSNDEIYEIENIVFEQYSWEAFRNIVFGRNKYGDSLRTPNLLDCNEYNVNVYKSDLQTKVSDIIREYIEYFTFH